MTYSPTFEVLSSGASSLGGLFSSVAQSFHDDLALVEGSRSRTFGELEKRSNCLAHAFLDEGLKKGDRVAVLSRNCIEYLEIELAAAKSGVIVAALNWRLTALELTHCIELVEPKLMIVQTNYLATVQDLNNSKKTIWTIGSDLDGRIDTAHARKPLPVVEPEAGLVILYTSGTTGMPKGALISHRAMIARSQVFVSELNLPNRSNFAAWAPLYHMASTDHSLATLLRGGTVFIVDGYQPDLLIDLLEKHSFGWFVLMPGMVGEFATACSNRSLKPKSVHVCGAMADLVPREDIAAVTKALNAPYANTFGATETGLPPATRTVIPIGEAPKTLSKRQNSFVELRLVDPKDVNVPNGEPGEIAVRGASLFSGYWNAEETNKHDFRNGWFHMGDVMRRNPDGSLDYVDRVKYMIKSGGENIYPAEIEQVILVDERVKEAIVVRKMDGKWGEVPVVFIVAKNAGLTQEEVLTVCRAKLAGYKMPKEVHFIQESDLPRSTTGKVQRHELEKRLTVVA